MQFLWDSPPSQVIFWWAGVSWVFAALTVNLRQVSIFLNVRYKFSERLRLNMTSSETSELGSCGMYNGLLSHT